MDKEAKSKNLPSHKPNELSIEELEKWSDFFVDEHRKEDRYENGKKPCREQTLL